MYSTGITLRECPAVLGRITDLPVQYYDAFQYLVYPWFMPVLFIVSGISARLYLDSHSDKEFIKSRTLKLLVPSTIGLFFFQFLQGYVNISLSGGFEGFASAGAGTPLWTMELFILPIWGASQILNVPVVSVYRIGFYFGFFILGYYVFSNDKVIERLKKIVGPLTAFAIVLSVVFTVMYFGENFADKPVNRGLPSRINSISVYNKRSDHKKETCRSMAGQDGTGRTLTQAAHGRDRGLIPVISPSISYF